jgi:hypothetical protein
VSEEKLFNMKILKGAFFHAEVFKDSLTGRDDSFSFLISLKPGITMRPLKLPKLKYLDIVSTEKTLIIHLNNERLRLLFNDFIFGLLDRFGVQMGIDTISELIESSIVSLVRLAERELEMSIESAMGLYGELIELKRNILQMESPLGALKGWQRPSPANHDFDYDSFSTEVKCLSKNGGAVRISSLFQLQPQPEKKLYLQVYRLDCIKSTDEDSIGDLYEEISNKLLPQHLVNDFVLKCQDMNFFYGGPSVQSINFKFVILESLTFDTDSDLFPRIVKDKIHPAITNLSYNIDLSSLEPFKISTQ